VWAATGRCKVLSREWEEAQKGFLAPNLGRNETLAKMPQQEMHAPGALAIAARGIEGCIVIFGFMDILQP